MSAVSRTTRGSWHHGSLREAVIETATALVRESGAQAVTLRAIVQRIPKEGSTEKLSHTAPMAHFGSITEILTEVAIIGWNALLAELTPKGDTAVDRLVFLGSAYREFARRNPHLFRVMYDERIWRSVEAHLGELTADRRLSASPVVVNSRADRPARFKRFELLRSVRDARDAAFSRYLVAVEEGQESGELRRDAECTTEVAARVMASLSHGLATEAIDEQLSDDEVLPILRIAARGLERPRVDRQRTGSG